MDFMLQVILRNSIVKDTRRFLVRSLLYRKQKRVSQLTFDHIQYREGFAGVKQSKIGESKR